MTARVGKNGIPSSMAWLTVFVPALSYFIISRLTWSWSRSLGPIVSDVVFTDASAPATLANVFYTAAITPPSSSSLQLQHPLKLVQSEGLKGVSSILWKHDSELGRGYLLLSETAGAGKIWRWEVGGGPIAIGKTLHMNPSGCRSLSKEYCTFGNRGSGPLAIDFQGNDHAQEGRLIVAERGERRIVRVEDATGARTPLVIKVPATSPTLTSIKDEESNHTTTTTPRLRRLETPLDMVLTPFGDLLFLEESSDDDNVVLYRLLHATHVAPLSSSMSSRRAHTWKNVSTALESQVQVVLSSQTSKSTLVGSSLALDASWTHVFVTAARKNDDSLWLARVSLLEGEDRDDDEEESSATNAGGLWDGTEEWIANLTALGLSNPPTALAVDRKGHVFMGTLDQGVLVLDSASKGGTYLGRLPVPYPITSMTLGEDGYLYLTSTDKLLRIRAQHLPVLVPTNMIPKRPKKIQ